MISSISLESKPLSQNRAVNHLTSIQAVSLGTKNVTVNAILPGVFPSKMTAFGISKSGDEMAKAQPTGMSNILSSFVATILSAVLQAVMVCLRIWLGLHCSW